MEIDHEIISMGICPFHSFKKGSCQLLAKVSIHVLVNHLGDLSLLRKTLSRLTDLLDITLTVLTGPFDSDKQISSVQVRC